MPLANPTDDEQVVKGPEIEGEPVREFAVGLQLSKTLDVHGIPARPGYTIVIVPTRVSSQWFVDNYAITDENRATWLVLTSPDRRGATYAAISVTLRELSELRTHLRRSVRLTHAGSWKSRRLRDRLLAQTDEQAAQVKQVEALMEALGHIRTNIDVIHETCVRKAAK